MRRWQQVKTKSTTAYYKVRYRSVRWGPGVRIDGRLIIRGPGRVTVGAFTRFETAGGTSNVIQTFRSAAHITLGPGCYLNGTTIAATHPVTIGSGAILGTESAIFTSNFHSLDSKRRGDPTAVRAGPVTVGEEAWLAYRVTVLHSTLIGDRTIIGTGCVVSGDIPSDAIVTSADPRTRVIG